MISTRIKSDFKKLRKQGYTAKEAMRKAKIESTWREFDCGEHDAPEHGLFCVRLQIIPDNFCNMDDLKGDTFNPEVNNDIQRSRLEREEKAFEKRVYSEGVYGVIGEYWNGDKWICADSCFGFIGNDWKDSGYDIDIKSETLRQYFEFYKSIECAKEIAETV